MPYSRYPKRKKKYSTYSKKKNMKRRTAYRKKKSSVYKKRRMMTRNGAAMMSRPVQATKLFVKLTYYDDVILSATNTATYAEYIFSQNSIYDPDITGTGHQPRGRDQYTALYENYLVHGCTYKFTLRPSTNEGLSTTAGPFSWGLVVGPENLDLSFSSITDMMEYPRNKFMHRRILESRASSLSALYSGFFSDYRNYTLMGYANTKKIHTYYGGNDSSTGQEFTWPTDYKGTSTNPNANNFITLWAASLSDGGTVENLPGLRVQVQLTYYVEFMTPIFPGSS